MEVVLEKALRRGRNLPRLRKIQKNLIIIEEDQAQKVANLSTIRFRSKTLYII